jgi:hypothetical protein
MKTTRFNLIKNAVTIGLAASLTLPLFAQTFNPKSDAWYFHNFSTPLLTWDDYKETFIGIAPTEAESGNFDPIFYEYIYKDKLAGPGNCFGMCLLALEMRDKGGCEGYCYPPYIYPGLCNSPGGPTQTELLHAINIVHGYQLNHRVIMYMIDLIAKHVNRDGKYVFDQFKYYMAKEGPCVLSVTESLAPGGKGHALIAYDYADLGSTKRIYIYDPNRSYYGTGGATYYDGKNNYVEINSTTGAWSFTMAGGTVWSGSPWSGGNLILFPLSIVGPRDRIPQSIFADISDALNKIIISGADISQISTAEGRHLFKPGTQELETDTSKAMNNLLPFSPFAVNMQPTDKQMIFFYRGSKPLDIEVKNPGQGYSVAMIGTKGYVSLKAVNGRGVEKIRIDKLNTNVPVLKFTNLTNPSYYQVELRSIVKENEKVRIYAIDKINPAVNVPLNITLSKQGAGIEMTSDKNVSPFELAISETGKERGTPVKQMINLEQGKTAKFSVGRSLNRKGLKLTRDNQ